MAQIALIAVIITSSFGLIRRNASKSTPPAAKLYRDRSYIRPFFGWLRCPWSSGMGTSPLSRGLVPVWTPDNSSNSAILKSCSSFERLVFSCSSLSCSWSPFKVFPYAKLEMAYIKMRSIPATPSATCESRLRPVLVEAFGTELVRLMDLTPAIRAVGLRLSSVIGMVAKQGEHGKDSWPSRYRHLSLPCSLHAPSN